MMSQHHTGLLNRLSFVTRMSLLAGASLLAACGGDGGAKPDKSNAAPAQPAAATTQSSTATRGTPIAKPVAQPTAATKTTAEPEPERPSRAGIKVQFGIMPGDYEDTAKGVLVGSVTPGASADAAGIKSGDRLMTWNGQEIPDIGSWMKLLSVAKPGDIVDVGVNRDGKIVPMKVTLKARQE